jgi:YHS domain-containing protein
MVTKLISESELDESRDDLVQYVCEFLLNMDNRLINDIYFRKELKKYINRIILNQRNYYRSFYNINFKISDSSPKVNKLEYIFDTETGVTFYFCSSYVSNKFDGELDNIVDENIGVTGRDRKLDSIFSEMNRIPYGTTGLTNSEMRRLFGYEIFKFYITRGLSMSEVGKRFKMCRSTVRTLINESKKNILKYYDDTYNNMDDDS